MINFPKTAESLEFLGRLGIIAEAKAQRYNWADINGKSQSLEFLYRFNAFF